MLFSQEDDFASAPTMTYDSPACVPGGINPASDPILPAAALAPAPLDVIAIPPFLISPSLGDLRKAWFLTPETWSIDHLPSREQGPFDSVALKRFIAAIQSWLSQWITQGGNPFIHPRLYRVRFPRCMQDAYTSLLCYLSKTQANEDTAMRIISDRASQLVADQEAPERHLDTFEHVARVQALLIYQTIRLFDGDIRHRHEAEQLSATLALWNRQMLDSAAHTARTGALLVCGISSDGGGADGRQSLAPVVDREEEEALWHAWILAESVRRTWLVASGVEAVYTTLQRGQAPCPGGLMFTTRRGVWAARSAFAWAGLCAEVDVWFMPRAQTQRLFVEARPDEVDEFGQAMLEITFGIESMERWGVAVRG